MVAMDLPGLRAARDMPREQISIELYGRVVAELCERLDLAPAVLVGNSMGGFVAAELAIRAARDGRAPDAAGLRGRLADGRGQAPVLAAGKAAGLLATSNVAQMQLDRAARPKLRHW